MKFREGTGIRLRAGRFTSVTPTDLSALQALLDRLPGVSIERVFDRPEEDLAQEKEQTEAQSGRPQADKNLFYFLTPPEGIDAAGVVAMLKGLSVVEDAYVAPAPKLSASGWCTGR